MGSHQAKVGHLPTPQLLVTGRTATVVTLSWSLPRSYTRVAQYVVERGTDGVSFPNTVYTGLGTSTSDNVPAVSGQTLYYRVRYVTIDSKTSSNSKAVSNVVYAPVISNSAPTSLSFTNVGGTYQWAPWVTDQDLYDTVQFSILSSFHPNITINNLTGEMYVPGYIAGQSGNVTIMVTDTYGLTDTHTCAVTVQAVTGAWPVQGAVSYLPIVPGARGFGMDTVAGSGRGTGTTKVLFVNSLGTGSSGTFTADAQGGVGYGTLLWCMNQTGPKTVIPMVSGLIDYPGTADSPVEFNTTYTTNTTVAFQCAPSPGLFTAGLLWGIGGSGAAANSLLWHVGALVKEKTVHNRLDAYRLQGDNIVLANCSGTYGVDECLEVYAVNGVQNLTLWQTMITDVINLASADAGHGAMLFGPGASSVSVLRCAILHSIDRNPLFRSANTTVADHLVFNVTGVGVNLQNESGVTTQTNVEELIGYNKSGSVVAVQIRNNGDYLDLLAGSSVHITGTQVVNMTALSNTEPHPLVSRIAAAYPTGYVTTAGWLSSTSDRALLRVNQAGPRPGDSACWIDGRRATFRNWLAQNGGDYGSIRTTFPAMPTIAANTVTHTTGADPIPLTNRNEIMPSGYTRLEEWLHRRHEDVMP